MKQKRIIAMSAAIALAFAVTTPANAQFGNILNKAKKAVKEKVEKKVEQKVEQTKNAGKEKAEKEAKKAAGKSLEKVGEKTGLPVPEVSSSESDGSGDGSSLYTLYKKDYKPSKEAIAAFPECQSKEVLKGCTRSVSQIYGAYEHLDPKYFPLQPYYKYPMIYGLKKGIKGLTDSSMARDYFSSAIGAGTSDNITFLPFIYDEKLYPELLTPTGEKMGVYADEPFRCAYAASFFADPNSEFGVDKLAQLVTYRSLQIDYLDTEKADDDGHGILDAKLGLVLPAPNFKHLRFERELAMIQMACSDVNIDLIADGVIKYFEKVIENDASCQQDPSLRTQYMLMGLNLYEKILTIHDDWRDKQNSDPKARRATMLYTRFNQTDEWRDIRWAARAANIPAVSMPKGVSVPADVKAKGDAAGRVLAQHRRDEFVKVVYLENKWHAFKQHDWPYKVTHYVIAADLITKSNGKTVLTHCALQKSVDGQKYVMVVGNDSEKHPVK